MNGKVNHAPRRRRPQTPDQRRRTFQSVRIGDLTKVFGDRYRGGKLYQFPDDDAGREDLRILLDHYAFANPLAIPRVIKARAPWLTDTEREQLLEQVSRYPRPWKAQDLGERLNLTETDRERFHIKSIGSIDLTPRQRRKLRKARDKIRKQAARRAAGGQSRQQYLAANAKSREQPWKAAGISRRTWYRQQAKAKAVAGTSPVTHDSDAPTSVWHGLPIGTELAVMAQAA